MGELVAQRANFIDGPIDGLIADRGLDRLKGAPYLLKNFGVNQALDLGDLADAALEVVDDRRVRCAAPDEHRPRGLVVVFWHPFDLLSVEDPVEGTVITPMTEALIDGLPGALTLRQIAPLCPGAENT